MDNRRTYLDYNASAPLLLEARAAMMSALSVDANPSSVHQEGRAARRIIEDSRRQVAALVGAKPEHVIFTSGASEAAAMVLTPDWQLGRGQVRMARLYVGATEHPCVMSGGRFPRDRITTLNVDTNGVLDIAALEQALAAHDKSEGLALVAVQRANNESGVIQPIPAIAQVVKDNGGVLIVDAVQASGRLPLDIAAGCGDFLILSSHKIGGPKGAGALVALSDLMMPQPLIAGGGQEKGHRGGTENLWAIAGFGAAAQVARTSLPRMAGTSELRDWLEAQLADIVPGLEIFGSAADRLANTTLFAWPGLDAQTWLMILDLAGVAVSTGSACSSGRIGPSHVLKAMGRGDIKGALRVSFGADTRRETLEPLLHVMRERLRGARPHEFAA